MVVNITHYNLIKSDVKNKSKMCSNFIEITAIKGIENKEESFISLPQKSKVEIIKFLHQRIDFHKRHGIKGCSTIFITPSYTF